MTNSLRYIKPAKFGGTTLLKNTTLWVTMFFFRCKSPDKLGSKSENRAVAGSLEATFKMM